jgi:Ribonucleotide reductase, small chain
MTPHAIAADQVSYTDLYARWEHGNWRATDIDFSRDREQWRSELTDIDRSSALWTYSLFFHGEDSVADNLSPFIDAAPREEQKYFLATQQVDEARHAVLFARFIREVIGAGNDVGSALDAAHAHPSAQAVRLAPRPEQAVVHRRPAGSVSGPRCDGSDSRYSGSTPAIASNSQYRITYSSGHSIAPPLLGARQ